MKRSSMRFLCVVLLVIFTTTIFSGAPTTANALNTAAIRYLSPAGADTSDCTLPSQPCKTVQYAVDQAAAGDALYLAAGTYAGVQTRNDKNQVAYVEKSLSLYGGYSANYATRSPAATPSVLDAALGGRILYLANAISLTLDGLQLKNGAIYQFGPGIYAGAGGNVLTITNTTIAGNQGIYYEPDEGSGLGLYLVSGSLQMDHSLLENNTHPNTPEADATGGGIFARNSSVNISTSTFMNNKGVGAGAFLYETDAVFEDVAFTNNQSLDSGDRAGGIYSYKGSLRVTNSTFTGNSAAGCGGAIWMQETPNVLIDGNTFTNNQGSAICLAYNDGGAVISNNHFEGNSSTSGGAIAMSSRFPLQVIDNEFINNRASQMGGAFSWYAGGAMQSLTREVVFQGNLFQGNQAGYGGAASVAHGVDFRDNQFIDNHAAAEGGALYHEKEPRGEAYHSVFEGNLLRGNSAGGNGGALAIYSECCDVNQDYLNSAFVDNQAGGLGGAVYMDNRVDNFALFQHVTFSGNTASDGSTFYLYFGGVNLFNSLFADAPVGFNNAHGYFSLDHVLFDAATVPTPVIYVGSWAAPDPDIRVTGSAGLAADGYHLTAASSAVDAGADLSLTYDIDQEPRLFGVAPDLGADESPYSKAAGMQARLLASQPEWKMTYSGSGVPPSSTFEQTYLVPYGNYEDDLTASQYAIESTFPAELNLLSTPAQPAMTYTASGGALHWTAQHSLAPGEAGWVGMTGQSGVIASGTALSASGRLTYTLSDNSTGQIPFSASSTVPARPLFPPLLVTPWTGEMCLDENKQLTATGLSSTNVTVRLYENNVLVGSATPDNSGHFSITWSTSLSATQGVTVTARSCESADNCSLPSKSVALSYPQGEWCPQRSYWEGDANGVHYTFHFRNEGGNYTTQDFQIPGLYGFWNTRLHLYSCCQTELNPFRVEADDAIYQTPSGHSGREWVFDIGQAHDVVVRASCSGFVSGDEKVSQGEVLIDPDGFVFDQAAGGSYNPQTGMFTPVKPLSGITVTAYYWVEDWQAWIPWPAELYDHQVNPQVTGANGYYAFFTPPGKYYLQASGKDGYQSWRSPEIEVISEIVHMNSPLTAWKGAAPDVTVISTPGGLSQAQVSIPQGGSVTWQASVDTLTTADALSALMTNPAARLLSALNPLTDPAGWDSGMLAPGGGYSRSFTQPGAYTYTDGFGHSGQVIVSSQSLIYIPQVRLVR